MDSFLDLPGRPGIPDDSPTTEQMEPTLPSMPTLGDEPGSAQPLRTSTGELDTTDASLSNPVRKLLEETLQIQSKAEEYLDWLLKEFQKNLPNERERIVRREAVRRKRLYVEKLQEKCLSNINQCYLLLQQGMISPPNSFNNASFAEDKTNVILIDDENTVELL